MQAASGVFAVGTGEYLSIQSQSVGLSAATLLKAAKDAEAAQKALAEKAAKKQDERDQLQKDNEVHQTNIEGTARPLLTSRRKSGIDKTWPRKRLLKLNKKLAADLAKWFPVMHKAQLDVMNQLLYGVEEPGVDR